MAEVVQAGEDACYRITEHPLGGYAILMPAVPTDKQATNEHRKFDTVADALKFLDDRECGVILP